MADNNKLWVGIVSAGIIGLFTILIHVQFAIGNKCFANSERVGKIEEVLPRIERNMEKGFKDIKDLIHSFHG